MIDRIEAANQLEELLPAFREAVNLMRAEACRKDLAYALLYELRLRVGYITRAAGVGVPPTADRKWAITGLGLEES